MTDNEKFPGGGPEGLNLTRVSGAIHAEARSFQGHIWAAPMTSRVITDCSVEEREG